MTPVLSKVLERLVCTSLEKYIVPTLDHYQFGSVKGCSPTTALVDMLHSLYKTADRPGSFSRVVLLDFAKAFDHIDHKTMLAKLNYIPPHLYSWLCAFLCDRRQRIKLGNTRSSWLHIKGGFPQGTVVGPRAFLVMINDLHTQVKHYKYVDDTTLIEERDSNSRTCQNKLQLACEQASTWAQRNLMNFNVSKTKLMDVCFLKKDINLPEITIAGERVKQFNSVKLLGIYITQDLKWDEHINYIHSKAAKRIYQLRLLKCAGASADILLNVYKASIRPTMEYACPAWHTNINRAHSLMLESIQKRALKILFPDSDYITALKFSKLPTLQDRREELCRTFFNGMMDPSHRLNKLLPALKSNKYNLRWEKQFQFPRCRTQRFKQSFVPYSLFNFQ